MENGTASRQFESRQYLRRLIDDRLQELALASSSDAVQAAQQAQHQVRGAADALTASGALPAREARAMLAQFDVTLLERGTIEGIHRRATAPQQGRAGLTGLSFRGAIPEFLRVLPLAGETDRLLVGHTSRYLSLDVWSDHLTLHIAISPPRTRGTHGAASSEELSWEGIDDVGRKYFYAGRDWRPSTAAIHFEPGLSGACKKLWLKAQGVDRPQAELVIEL